MAHTDTKENIINSTIELLNEEGLIGATTQAICKKANVSQGRINYHFNSKNELLIRIAELIPILIRKEVDSRLGEDKQKYPYFSTYCFDALFIRIMYEDNAYMQTYRDLYSQDFVCAYLARTSENVYAGSFFQSIGVNSTMALILANATAYSITSLGKRDVYTKLKNDVESVIRSFVRYQLMLFPITNEEIEQILDEIVQFAFSIDFTIHGISDVRFN